MGRFLFGVLVGLVVAPVLVLCWLVWGKPPVAVADRPLPFESRIASSAQHARIDRSMIKTPPIQPTEDNLVAGAQIYNDQCAVCHGLRGKASAIAPHMFPHVPQLWQAHRNGTVVGVSDDPPGETYWKVANGIRLSGMPAFDHILTNEQMWQVSLLLANANKPLPPAATVMVSAPPEPGNPPAAAPAPSTPAGKQM